MTIPSKSRASWKRGRVTSSVLLALATTFATANVSAAAVPNLELHRSMSASTSAAKSTTAACPSGRTLTGVGGGVNHLSLFGAGSVVIDDLTPTSTRTQNTTTGYEVAPFTANWFLRSYAICASTLPGASFRSATTATNGTDVKAATANCPPGTRLTGAAGQINGGIGNVVMDDLRPNGNPATSVTVTGDEVNPDTSWSATAYAICANPLIGQQNVSATSLLNSNSSKSITASCTAGRKVTGLGAQVNGAFGEVVIDRYTPNDLLSSVTVTASEARDVDGTFTGNWSVTAYALCATP